MKLLMVHPGASYSTADVHQGLSAALARQGVELVQYNLDARIAMAGEFLHYVWEKQRQPVENHPTPSDVIYLAGQGILERALRHEVDGVFIVSGMFVHPDYLILLRRAGLKTAILLTESPYDDEQQRNLLPYVDLAFTNERTSVGPLRVGNPQVYYLPHAYDPERHRPEPADEEPEVPSHDVVFVGSGFRERIALLEAVDWTGIDFGLYGMWDLLEDDSPLRPHLRKALPVDNAVTAALYRRAKIGLNLHRTSIGYDEVAAQIDYAESINPRCYELAACGCFFLSDHRAELSEVLPSVNTFDTAERLEAAIRYWGPRDDDRRRIAQRNQADVAEHTFDQRAGIVSAHLSGILQPARPERALIR